MIDPDVADTRMVLVPVSCNGLFELPLPPQPTVPMRAISTRPQSICTERARLPITKPLRRTSVSNNALRPFQVPSPAVFGLIEEIIIEVVALVPSANVTCEGLNWQFIPIGRPEQAKDTAPDIPEREATCRLTAEEAAP